MDRSSCPASRHGTYSAYRLGCRCDDAREDWRLYHKRRREGRAPVRRVPAIGSTRRLRALQAIGWPLYLLARNLGGSYYTLREIPGRQLVLAATARDVQALYERLAATDGPSRTTENRAWAAGYPPPGAWVGCDIDDPAAVPNWIRPDDPDEVAAERVPAARAGQDWRVNAFHLLTREEQAAAYRRALERGVSMRAMQSDWQVSSRVLNRLGSAA
jgi:hypothetical protein